MMSSTITEYLLKIHYIIIDQNPMSGIQAGNQLMWSRPIRMKDSTEIESCFEEILLGAQVQAGLGGKARVFIGKNTSTTERWTLLEIKIIFNILLM